MDAGTTPTAPGDNPDIAPEFELVEISWRGLTWNIPKDRGQWDMNVGFEFEEGHKWRGLFTLLGGSPENIDAVRAQVYSKARTNREADQLMDHATKILNAECTG